MTFADVAHVHNFCDGISEPNFDINFDFDIKSQGTKPRLRHERLNRRGGQMLVTRFLHCTPDQLSSTLSLKNINYYYTKRLGAVS